MAKLDKEELSERVFQAIREGGWNALYLSHVQEHPIRLQMYKGQERFPVRVYIWNLTHGGGAKRPTHEYRIQITPTSLDHFDPEPGGKTLILGWWEEEEVFAAFDYSKHAGPLGRSPSFQIGREALEKAQADGLAPYPKGNKEIALAIRPDFLAEYIKNLEPLHELGESEQTIEVLSEVAENSTDVNEAAIEALNEPRKIAIRAVQIRVRAVTFPKRVLNAYNHACALCQLQLELVEAAHIIPITHPNSIDETHNGLALCTLHHRAYDNSLVTIDESYHILINEAELSRLQAAGRSGGRKMFIDGLKSPIRLPAQIKDRPQVQLIQIANKLRGWTDLAPGQARII